MAGTRHKTFGDTDIADRYERTPKSRKMRRSELKDIEPCFHGLPGTHGLLRPHWNAEGADLEGLGDRIDNLWKLYVDSWVNTTNTYLRAGPPSSSEFKFGDIPGSLTRILEDWVLGFHEPVKSFLRGIIDAEYPTRDEIEEVLRQKVRRKSYLPIVWRYQKIPEKRFLIMQEGARHNASAARRIAQVLGIEDEVI